MTAFDRRSAVAIAGDIRAGHASAVAVMEETVARIAAYDAVQPQIWISRARPDDLIAAARAIDATSGVWPVPWLGSITTGKCVLACR